MLMWGSRPIGRPLTGTSRRGTSSGTSRFSPGSSVARVPIPRIGGASVRDRYMDPAGSVINPLIKMANIVAIMIISLIAIHG